MEHVESTTAAEVMDGMVIETEENVQDEALAIESAAQSLAAEEAPQQEDPAAQPEESQNGEDGADEREAQIREGIQHLFAQGWIIDELTAFSNDEGARADIAAGRSVQDAAMAYLRRQMRSAQGASESEQAPAARGRKHGVPSIRTGASENVREPAGIDAMTDEQFAAFSRRAQDLARSGKKVLIK